MFEPEKHCVRMLFHIFLVCLLVQVQKSMLLAKPWPPVPGGNAAIDYLLVQLCRHLTTCRSSTCSRETIATAADSTGSCFESASVSILTETAACRAEFPREYESNSLLALVVFRGVQSECLLKFHWIPAKPICHVRFLLFSGSELI